MILFTKILLLYIISYVYNFYICEIIVIKIIC